MFSDESLFASTAGGWHFDPEMLMQHRPVVRGPGDYLTRSAATMAHERAHWLQYAGSTVGSLLLTLTRAEDLTIGLGLRAMAADDRAAHAFVRRQVAEGSGLVPVRGNLPDVRTIADTYPPPVAAMTMDVVRLRWLRRLLLSADGQWSWDLGSRLALVRDLPAAANSAYALHTGGSRQWTRQPAGSMFSDTREEDIAPVTAGARELTTKHLMESAALLNEWGVLFTLGWWRDGQTSKTHRSLPAEIARPITDSLEQAGATYRAGFERAAAVLLGPDLASRPLVDVLSEWVYTLAACFDIALNPPCPPISPDGPRRWDEFYPPARYERALTAARRTGPLPANSGQEEYVAYRRALLEAGDLDYGMLDHRSHQRPDMGPALFCDEDADTASILASGSFDYTVWAMESLHGFRAEQPLRWAVPYLTLHTLPGSDRGRTSILHTLLDEGLTPLFAPLAMMGHDVAKEQRLSARYADHLHFTLVVDNALRQLAFRSGSIDLRDVVDQGEAADPEYREAIVEALVSITGIPELRSWRLLLQHERPKEPPVHVLDGLDEEALEVAAAACADGWTASARIRRGTATRSSSASRATSSTGVSYMTSRRSGRMRSRSRPQSPTGRGGCAAPRTRRKARRSPWCAWAASRTPDEPRTRKPSGSTTRQRDRSSSPPSGSDSRRRSRGLWCTTSPSLSAR